MEQRQKKELMLGVGAAIVLILFGVLKVILGSAHPSEAVAGPSGETVVTASEHKSTTLKVREQLEAEGRERARAAIEEHKKAISANWYSDETPDRLMAIGNLYQYKVEDNHSALEHYRALIDNFPQHSGVPQAYVEIATCYEKLGEPAQAMYVYQEMIEKLDPSLQHTKFAKLKLEGK